MLLKCDQHFFFAVREDNHVLTQKQPRSNGFAPGGNTFVTCASGSGSLGQVGPAGQSTAERKQKLLVSQPSVTSLDIIFGRQSEISRFLVKTGEIFLQGLPVALKTLNIEDYVSDMGHQDGEPCKKVYRTCSSL